MKPTIKPNYQITIHRDCTVSFWNVYGSVWERKPALSITDAEMAALTDDDRAAIKAARASASMAEQAENAFADE